jgi:hypothetical protein
MHLPAVMKTNHFLLLTLLAIIIACSTEPKVDTPEPVQKKFSQLYPNATEVTWEQEDTLYEAGFRVDTVNKSVSFFADGTVRVMETDLAIELLPQQIKDYVAQQTGGQPIEEAEMIIFADGITQYEAGAGGKDYLFDAAGTFLSVETEEHPREKHN